MDYDWPIDLERIQAYFDDPKTVSHYARAVANIGLWKSEEAAFRDWIRRDHRILDIGCGAGRIAFGLWRLGYRNIVGVDLSQQMVIEATHIARCLEMPVVFEQEDATDLSVENGRFDIAIFGFNGLMQIPGRNLRRRALREIKRALASAGVFIFTTLDRDDPLYRNVFQDEGDFSHDVTRNPNLLEEGDRHFKTAHGTTFMHVPHQEEVIEDLELTGWSIESSRMRSEISSETEATRSFSENCRF